MNDHVIMTDLECRQPGTKNSSNVNSKMKAHVIVHRGNTNVSTFNKIPNSKNKRFSVRNERESILSTGHELQLQ